MKPSPFAFLVHLRNSYREDLAYMHKAFGLIPDLAYRAIMQHRPVKPFIWSRVTLQPHATETEGYIIMLPYTGRQLLNQQKKMLPLINNAIDVAASKGAGMFGLGALSSPITLGGKLVQNNKKLPVTNGNAYTAVITYQRIQKAIDNLEEKPTVALVGATGSVGSLVCQLLAKNNAAANLVLLARNEKRLHNLQKTIKSLNSDIPVETQTCMSGVPKADIVVLLTSSADCLLHAAHVKANALVIDVTQPRNTSPELRQKRPDINIVDGGLVQVPHLRFTDNHISLPKGVSFACLAETMLLAQNNHASNFSIGNPTLEMAEYIMQVAEANQHLGFRLAPDHCFGKSLHVNPAITRHFAGSMVPQFS